MSLQCRAGALLVLGACVLASASPARSSAVLDLLDSYERGHFDAVVAALAATTGFDDVLQQLRRDGPAWIAAADSERRELVAATVALEAARAGAWREWKLIQRQPPMCATGLSGQEECYQPLNVLYWQAPPLLVEWGCALLRQHETPRPIERWWQLAALSVAQRAGDPQFLIGDPHIGLGVEAGEIGNREDEIKHLEHVAERFPDEVRFTLAQGIARERDLAFQAIQVYGALADDPIVGGEAMMRLGGLHLRHRRLDRALRVLELADTLTRDPYVVFLARYFKGQLFEQQRQPAKAEAAYRGAVAAIPHAQSATVALAALTFRNGRREEAHTLIRGMLSADPRPRDPWRTYMQADDRFWPDLIGRLRAEILK